jgi:DNA-binding transcriptional ArsR family regulator
MPSRRLSLYTVVRFAVPLSGLHVFLKAKPDGQDRVLLLVKSAQERVGDFILDIEKRAAVSNYVELPMLRQDIADYLGLTIETVSRILTALEKHGAIEIVGRKGIVVRNHSLLKTVIADRETFALSWYLRKSTSKNGHRAKGRRTRILPTGGPRSSQQLRLNGRAG